MKLRFLALCLALAFTSIAAHAQVGLYINPVGIHISNSSTDTGPFAFLGDNVTSRMFYGVNIGGYDDFFKSDKIAAGIDIRDSFSNGNRATLNSFLVGARVAANSATSNFKPYAQLMLGVGTTKPPTTGVHVSKVQYGVFGGVDYTIASHVDFRVVELGYGGVSTTSSANYNGLNSYPASRLFSVSSGLVFTIK